MSTINRILCRLTLVAALVLTIAGCRPTPQRIEVVHQYGRLYMVTIGDSTGGGGRTIPMIMTAYDCTDCPKLPISLMLCIGDTTGGGGYE